MKINTKWQNKIRRNKTVLMQWKHSMITDRTSFNENNFKIKDTAIYYLLVTKFYYGRGKVTVTVDSVIYNRQRKLT